MKFLVGCLLLLLSDHAAFAVRYQEGVPPLNEWNCPDSHPIKGNLTTRTGECIYHVSSGAFYERTKPELCFESEDEARTAGCRRSMR